MDYNQSVSSVSDEFLRLVEKRHEINDPRCESARSNRFYASFWARVNLLNPGNSSKCLSQHHFEMWALHCARSQDLLQLPARYASKGTHV